MDERQHGTIGTASTIVMLITFIYLLIEITYKFVATKDILNCSWEIVLILIISVAFFIVMRVKKEMDLPKTFFGKPLTTELTKKARKIRLKTYIVNSLFFAFAITIISVIFAFLGLDYRFDAFSILAYVGELIGLFLISLLFEYLWCEFQVRRYNKYLNELEK